MELQTLNVKVREACGKGAAHRSRSEGAIPVVLYGHGEDPASLSVNRRVFEHLVHGRAGEHAVVRLEVEGAGELSTPALLKAVQHHPVRGEIIHADFQRIDLNKRITTLVPIELTGHAKGVTEGGVVDHQLREIEVECLPLEVPEAITVDVTELGMGDSIHVSGVVAPPNVTIMTDPERVVTMVYTPRVAVEEEAPAEAGEVAVVGEEEKAAEEEGAE